MKPRVVSLLPSATEIICALGCSDQLVGRSHECDYPESVQRIPVCTAPKINPDASSAEIDRQIKNHLHQALSLYAVDVENIRELIPDIIFTQAQCVVCAVSEVELQKALNEATGLRPRIVSFSPKRLADVWSDMANAAKELGTDEHGRSVIKELKMRVVDVIEKTCLMTRRPTVGCIEWLDPLMAAGNWVPELVDFAGGKNVFGEAGQHSPWLQWEELTQKNPDKLVLMPCGFDMPRIRRELSVLERHPAWAKLRAVKSGNVFVADGNHYFNRPGPRLVESLEILAEICHSDTFDFGHRNRGWIPLPSGK